MKGGADTSGGVLVAIGIVAIVLGEYPMFTWYDRYLGWGIGVLCMLVAFFLFMKLVDSEFEDDDAHDEEWIDPYN